MMKIDWMPQLGDLVSVPDSVLFSRNRRYAIIVDVSLTGQLLEILIESTFMYIHKDEVLPITDLEGRWIQLGR